MDIKNKLHEYTNARNQASEWLLSQQKNNGEVISSSDGAFYYRLLWAWTVFGNTEAANKLLNWIRTKTWRDGGLGGKYPVGPLFKHYSYILSNIVIGAQIMQAYDIVFQGLETLCKFQDTNTGGFANGTEDLKPHNWHENWTSAQIGMAFLMAGDIRRAERVGNFLKEVWDEQTELPDRLFFVYDSYEKKLVKNADSPRITFVIEASEPRQWFWGPGLVSAFLGMLFQATGSTKYLDLGMKYQDFVQNCTQKQFNGIEVCKTGWGAAIMYQLTKEKRYRDWAIAVGDYFVRSQRPDGRWIDDRFSPSTIGQDIAITGQQALWINSIIASLASSE